MLAAGGHLKTTVTVTRGREAFVSQHIGDLSNAATVRFYRETAQRASDRASRRDAAACRLRSASRFHSTRFAEKFGLPLVRVQHHAAHVAAIRRRASASRRRRSALALDGHGLGDDGGNPGAAN